MSGYSKTPLAKKLGYKEQFNALLVGAPKDYMKLVSPLPDGVQFTESGPYDLIHFFVNDVDTLENGLKKYRENIVSNGMIWVSWYKKASKKPTEIIEDTIRDTALALDLVDIKVCSINDDWSALKLVIPVSMRKVK